MINSDRTLNIYTTILLDALTNSNYNSLTEREKEIVYKARVEVGSLSLKEGGNITTGFLNSKNSDIFPVLLTAVFSYKSTQKSPNFSPLTFIRELDLVISSFIDGTIDRSSKAYNEVLSFLNYFNNDYNKKVYLSNVQSNSLIYA